MNDHHESVMKEQSRKGVGRFKGCRRQVQMVSVVLVVGTLCIMNPTQGARQSSKSDNAFIVRTHLAVDVPYMEFWAPGRKFT